MADQKPETLAEFLTRVIGVMTEHDRSGVAFNMPVRMKDNSMAVATFELTLTELQAEEAQQPKDYPVH